MRELMIALVVACTLIGVAEAFYKMVPPANAKLEAYDAAIDGLRIAVPPSMKKFPSELVPVP